MASENEIAVFAETNYRGKRLKFGIKTDDRRRHIYVIGKTGMGKTTLLENMVFSDLVNGRGVAVVDPHGDFAEKILDYIPPKRINDVIYFNPADMEYPIAFNVMENVSAQHRHLIASGLIGVFKKIWADSWGPRLEYVLRNAVLALLEYPGSTLLGVPRILVDKNYRKKVVAKVTDPVVKAFWVDEFSKYSNQFLVDAISPIQNKVGQFLSSSLVRNIVSQTKTAFDLREIMDNQKILIINLAKGRIGEDYSALLGAMMITKIQLAAMERVDIAEVDRKDFYLYVDEFQNFATESFATILSEARKYHLNLTIAHQYIGQLITEQSTTVRDAVFGNVGTIVTFRVGAQDAEFLEKEFEPVFEINDIVNLPKHHIYLKLMIDGVTSSPFSALTLPPLAKISEANIREKIIRSSRERYATNRAIIEEKIARWSGVVIENGDNNKTVKAVKKEAVVQTANFEHKAVAVPKIEKMDNNRNAEIKNKNIDVAVPKKLYPAVCQKCGINIEVPFEPDPKRATFCRDCLREVRSALAKNKHLNTLGISTDKPHNNDNNKTAFTPVSRAQIEHDESATKSQDTKPEKSAITLKEAFSSKPILFNQVKTKIEDVRTKPEERRTVFEEVKREKVDHATADKKITIKPGERVKFIIN